MTPTQFWQTMFGMSAFASVLGVGCYGLCRILRPHPAIGIALTGLLTFLAFIASLNFGGFLLVFPVTYLCFRCGVELHRKTRKEDTLTQSQGIVFDATAVTLLVGVFAGGDYFGSLAAYAPYELAVRNIVPVYITLLAVVPSLAPLLWMRHPIKTLLKPDGDEK